jgi:phosphate transport system protein
MSELQKNLDNLMLRLDRMALRAEQAVKDALRAVAHGDVETGGRVDQEDSILDKEEVEIEQECIRLLALFQPTAIDLRTLCFVIKANSDLERIADKAAGMGRRIKHFVSDNIQVSKIAGFEPLRQATLENLARTVRMIGSTDADAARQIIAVDVEVDRHYKTFIRTILGRPAGRSTAIDEAMTLILLARALERIGDLCTNIAEDVVFLKTGDIIRHSAMAEPNVP